MLVDVSFLLIEVKLCSAYSSGLEGTILIHWYLMHFKSVSVVVEAHMQGRDSALQDLQTF